MKLMFVIPSLKAGGLERVASELSNYWSEHSPWEIFLVTLDSKAPFYELSDRVVLHQSPPKADRLGGWKKALILYSWLPKITQQIKPDVILSFGEGINAFVLWRLANKRIPVFVGNRTTPLTSLTGMRGRINPFFYPRATKVFVQTQKAVSVLEKKYKNTSFEVIPNPIKQFECAHDYSQKRIVCVGSLGGQKNQLALIKIFQSLRTRFPEWELLLAGDGPNRAVLELYLQEARLEDKVSLLGTIRELNPVFAQSSIFAFTSRLEGFPNALGEAMSAGLASIAYDCVTGPSELIRDNKNGYLVALDDEAQFRNKLALLMESQQRRQQLGQQAHHDLKTLEIQKIGNRFLHYFDSATTQLK